MATYDFKPSNMVMVAKLNCKVDMKCVYDCLSVIPLDRNIKINMFTTNNKVKVPFFGTNTALISIRYYSMSKGLKRETNPRMNAVFLDLQYANKNIHVKISEQAIQMTGILNDKMGSEVVDVILDHLLMNQSHLDYMKSKSNEILINTANWVLQYVYSQIKEGDDFIPYVHFEENIVVPQDIDFKIATFFLVHSYGLDTYEQFYVLLQKLITYSTIYTGNLSIRRLSVVNSIYNYDLGTKISLIPLAVHLDQIDKFDVSLANWVGKSFQVKMSTSTPIDDKPSPTTTTTLIGIDELEGVNSGIDHKDSMFAREDEPESDLHNHTFTLYPKGTIKQNSPSFMNEAYRAYTTLMIAIQEFLYPASTNEVCTS
jgi:hypothetical protein